MNIPSLAQKRDTSSLAGRHVLLFGAGVAGGMTTGWSLGKATDRPYGVGRATAIVYARYGATVSCVDMDLASAQATVDEIVEEGGRAHAVACNATKAADVERVVADAVEREGRIDVLHNNIGIAVMGGPVETSEADFDRVIAVNLKSIYLAAKYTLPVMERQGSGSIINISSFAAERFTVPWIAYCASKGAINAMTMGIAAQYAPKGIRCNAIAPGLLSTPMVQAAHKNNHAGLEDMMRSRDAAVPMGWQGEGWDVGEASAFLASDEARFITGQVLAVDGGSMIMMPSKPWQAA